VDGPDGQGDVKAELLAWVASVACAPVSHVTQIAGGNRCVSWAVEAGGQRLYLRWQPPRPPSAEPYTVWREAGIYQALAGSDVPAPRLIAVHETHQAILTELVPGRADYRRIADRAERETIAREFIAGLARLHRLDAAHLAPGATIADCVRREIEIWRAMYHEAKLADPLIAFAFDWIDAHLPQPEGRPVLVHGDAGPGNFLFENGHLTALLDWELAHPGDPMEDLAWFSMRNVMEPVPDFAACIRAYADEPGMRVDLARIRYHRVLVSLRVVIIRHRNVTGQPGNSIVSQALNQRLLIEAMADASGIVLERIAPLRAGDTALTVLYDSVLEDLRGEIAEVSQEPRAVAAAKGAAKVVKYLRDLDRLGDLIAAEALDGLAAVLGERPASVAEGLAEMLARHRSGALSFETVLRQFARITARAAEPAAGASGGLAHRHYPSLGDQTYV